MGGRVLCGAGTGFMGTVAPPLLAEFAHPVGADHHTPSPLTQEAPSCGLGRPVSVHVLLWYDDVVVALLRIPLRLE